MRREKERDLLHQHLRAKGRERGERREREKAANDFEKEEARGSREEKC